MAESDGEQKSVAQPPATTQTRIPLKSTGNSFVLQPATFEEAWKMATLLAQSDMVPKAYKGNAGNVLVAIQWGAEFGVSPMAAIQNIAVINGSPSIYGDLGKALLMSSGLCEDFHITAADEIKTNGGRAICRIKRKGIPTEFIGQFSLDDAKRAGLLGKDNYKNYPERQVQWRAFWFAMRDGFADMLKGLRGAEEVLDYTHIQAEANNAELVDTPKRLSDAKPADETIAAAVQATVIGADGNLRTVEVEKKIPIARNIREAKELFDK